MAVPDNPAFFCQDDFDRHHPAPELSTENRLGIAATRNP